MEAIFTVSKNADIIFDLRNFGISGFKNATNKKEGRNIPMVAANAPLIPPICHPIKVAEEKTGPGVNCPTAMASINCSLNPSMPRTPDVNLILVIDHRRDLNDCHP